MTKKIAEKETAEAPAKNEPKFRLDKLQNNCRKLFGVTESVFIGASAGLSKAEYSISEMKSIIKKWCEKEAE